MQAEPQLLSLYWQWRHLFLVLLGLSHFHDHSHFPSSLLLTITITIITLLVKWLNSMKNNIYVHNIHSRWYVHRSGWSEDEADLQVNNQ